METVASVKRLLQSFNSILWSRLGFRPVSFFEELNTPGTPDMFGPIVNSEDVRVEGQKHIGLHADHWNTWNFSDPLSSTYKAMSTVLQSFYHSLQVIKSNNSFHYMDPVITGLLQSLHVNNTERLSVAMKGTCSWIFDHHAFKSWIDQPSGLLWLQGKPGSGKSTLLRYIYQSVKFRQPTSLLFFQFSYSSHNSLNAMLRSLIFQLLVTSPSYQLNGIRDTYAIRTEMHGDYGTDWHWSDPELASYLQKSFLQATQDNSHFVVFLDALDEATEELSVISVILDILTIPSIRICTSSRSSPEFPDIDAHTIVLEDVNTADITYYAESIVSSAKGKDSNIQRDLVQNLIAASDGIFLYVHLVLSNLEIWMDKSGPQKQDRLGHTDFPERLEDLYSLIISHIKSNERSKDIVRHLFQWVAFATRPLTVPELMNAMSFEKVEGYDLCLHSYQTFHEPIDYCSCYTAITSDFRGLITVQTTLTAPKQSVVGFVHQSVFDFLMEYESMAFQPDTLELWGHEALARSCCQIILSEVSSRHKSNAASLSDTRQISSYALGSWMSHLKKALELGPSCSDLLLELSQKHCLEGSLVLEESSAARDRFTPRSTQKYSIDMIWETKEWEASSPLLLICAVGHVDSCQRYISLGGSYNDRDSLYGISCLGWAAANGHVEIVKLLIERGAPVDYSPNDTSPLQLAVQCGKRKVVQQLLKAGPGMSCELTTATQSALSRAASLGRASMVNLLVSYGANALTPDEFGWSSLHHAIAAGKRATLARLLSTIPKVSFERLKDLPPRNLPGWVRRVLLAFGLGLCCRGSGSCSSSTNTGPMDSRKSGKRGSQGSKKRGRDMIEDMDESDQQSMAPPPQKQPRHPFELRFACPYNKRCPNRFGGACSNFGFPDMHRLKEHLFRRHFLGCDKKTRCGRCKAILPETEIQDHLILAVACEPLRVAMNYEDGFDTNQSDTLKSLKPKQFETPVHHWEKTFNTVFPDWTTDLPSPYHETTETECRIRVAARLRSEEFRQEVWRNPSNMGREVFEQLANLLDPWPRASTRPGSQTPTIPEELRIRPGVIQEHISTEMNTSVGVALPMEPQEGTASSDALASAPVLNSSAQIYRPIPPHFLFPQHVSDTLSLSLFSGTGSLNSFDPGHESMYGDTDANDASMSSWDCSFANAQMGQTSNDPLGFTLNAPTPASIPNSSRSENQLNRNTDIAFSGDTQPAEYEDATNTFWIPSRRAD
ncbi:uncharacterized protein FFUJ_12000 [Fusarium fujikuroi IMI 58289]|uniref:Nephrocystin 3-like N-terminal domain-containing protein n=1 Tax=Gibberella fujikuroi (strain CBS 195.34 / IMI 58289 / NRRL A-6831) TaxID=1279085 RepID=S0ELN3_GIBF5|nr:uncharacterized protein FFUJ_12000 [Fusarium fujikuroi IMI 58289]KLP12847.1 uncharacterized protein LW94_1803 [Fusarium fujikuroi]CCT75948.1 uncharacterized protein FFUJ_12000 [Fusarium fujikuroi IMI 58289]SCO14897.1 uncharacterized protein FFM5_11007 [Fusarium fujikuroi]